MAGVDVGLADEVFLLRDGRWMAAHLGKVHCVPQGYFRRTGVCVKVIRDITSEWRVDTEAIQQSTLSAWKRSAMRRPKAGSGDQNLRLPIEQRRMELVFRKKSAEVVSSAIFAFRARTEQVPSVPFQVREHRNLAVGLGSRG